uniref:cellulose 1,4-beta-cellobiosidase (non-reducing end) n=1 Tax=uncultured symbiotic protist of Cryptocercus punctulatus TaxID=403662 RepID=A4UX59_9EUKA|nr:putative glycosyl hydrolase family7 [uncultured symbiotic protist of Cryptocercus punctulatus]
MILALLVLGKSLGIATNQAETHPKLTWTRYQSKGSGSTVNGEIVLDSNWRWTHHSGTNCYDGNTWSTSLCPDPTTCSNNCDLDGADYPGTYGISTSGNSLKLGFVTHGSYSTNIGSRVYLLRDSKNYEMFKLKNKEFTFTVDDSKLPCGLNGALYFVAMDEDGGVSKNSINKAGAQYGTGYCDAQCPHDMKFINGEANVLDWKPQSNDENSGNGRYGACCTEMDIWEANSMATAYTPHVCTVTGLRRCEGTECGDTDNDQRYNGICDKDGCDFNSYRLGDKSFFGVGKTVDSSKPVTVVTQFVTSNGQDSGILSETRRKYVQGGKVIENSKVNVAGITAGNSVTDTFCNEQKKAFGDNNDFEKKGGLGALSKQLDAGMVLVLSLWDDHSVNMLWLDSTYPTNAAAGALGTERGACATSSGKPSDVESQSPDATVTFSDIKFGPIDSTY